MKLIVGGAYQGKKEAACRLFGYAPEEFIDGNTCAFADLLSCRAADHLQELIRRGVEEGYPLAKLFEQLPRENPDVLLISDEVGCGVVPILPEERAFRETAGRLCCGIAAQADVVVRVVAGIPTVIKGELP